MYRWNNNIFIRYIDINVYFCRYFKGDIQIASVDGYGTDVYVYLQSLSHMAQVCRYLSIIYT